MVPGGAIYEGLANDLQLPVDLFPGISAVFPDIRGRSVEQELEDAVARVAGQEVVGLLREEVERHRFKSSEV